MIITDYGDTTVIVCRDCGGEFYDDKAMVLGGAPTTGWDDD